MLSAPITPFIVVCPQLRPDHQGSLPDSLRQNLLGLSSSGTSRAAPPYVAYQVLISVSEKVSVRHVSAMCD